MLLLLVPHLLALDRDELVDHLLVGLLVALLLLVEFLERAYLLAAGEALVLFHLLDGSLTLQRNSEHILVTRLFSFDGVQAELAFGLVVLDQVLVALPVKMVVLVVHLLLGFFFLHPLFFEH